MFWKRKKFKIGDKVLTPHDETGTIVSEWDRKDKTYDWWVEIRFEFRTEKFVSKLPFKDKQLRKYNG
jgi:hypothetical protein